MDESRAGNPLDWGPNALVMGGSGTGKTHGARTLIDCGIEVRAIFTEPRWAPLRDYSCADGLHIAYRPPSPTDWSAMIERSRLLTTMSWDINVKRVDPHKSTFLGFVNLLTTIASYTCDRCGENFGDATEWGNDKCLWFDSLSGLNHMAMAMVVGGAVAKSSPQWGAAMQSELDLVNELCFKSKCWFILVAHIEKLMDEINGGYIIQPSALGRKNAPELPKNFDDVFLCRREGKEFSWTTAAAGIDLKPTYLPFEDKIVPDYRVMYEAWKKVSETGENPVPKLSPA